MIDAILKEARSFISLNFRQVYNIPKTRDTFVKSFISEIIKKFNFSKPEPECCTKF